MLGRKAQLAADLSVNFLHLLHLFLELQTGVFLFNQLLLQLVDVRLGS